MGGADHLFAIILLVSGILGVLRGFIRETISLMSWLLGLWLAWHFAYLLNPWLGGPRRAGHTRMGGPRDRADSCRRGGRVHHGVLRHRVTGIATTIACSAACSLMRGVVVIGLLVMPAGPLT
jgi:hypothetical protein